MPFISWFQDASLLTNIRPLTWKSPRSLPTSFLCLRVSLPPPKDQSRDPAEAPGLSSWVLLNWFRNKILWRSHIFHITTGHPIATSLAQHCLQVTILSTNIFGALLYSGPCPRRWDFCCEQDKMPGPAFTDLPSLALFNTLWVPWGSNSRLRKILRWKHLLYLLSSSTSVDP